jgi:hypothetical protein
MLTQALPVAAPPLLAVRVSAEGKVEVACHIPKIEAVKLLANVLEELRLQAYREQERLIQVAQPAHQ